MQGDRRGLWATWDTPQPLTDGGRQFVRALPARTGKLAVTRLDGSPHVAPVWVDVDGDGDDARLVFMTSADTIKGKSILRDGRVAICFDDERPPFSFATITGTTTTSTDPTSCSTGARGSPPGTWATTRPRRTEAQRRAAGDGGVGDADERRRQGRRRRLTRFW